MDLTTFSCLETGKGNFLSAQARILNLPTLTKQWQSNDGPGEGDEKELQLQPVRQSHFSNKDLN